MAKATAHIADFTNVKEGGTFNTKRIEAGDYLAKIAKVEDAPVKSGENKGRAQYLFTIKLVDQPSSTFPYYCQLTENQLWKLRNILVAAGKSVPKKKQKVDPNVIVGKLVGVSIEDDEYEGKERSAIAGIFPPADLPDAPTSSDDDEPEEEVEVEENDDVLEEEEVEEEEVPQMSRTEIKAAIVAIKADFKAKKSQSDEDLLKILRDLEEESESSDDDDEEEEAPAPKAKAKTKAKKTKAKVEEIDDDELEELDIDSL